MKVYIRFPITPIKKADGKYIFFLNPDTLLRNNAIGELFRFLELNMNVGACGGNLYDEEGNATTSFSRKYPSFLNQDYSPVQNQHSFQTELLSHPDVFLVS